MKAIVTGANGFLGSTLIEKLLKMDLKISVGAKLEKIL